MWKFFWLSKQNSNYWPQVGICCIEMANPVLNRRLKIVDVSPGNPFVSGYDLATSIEWVASMFRFLTLSDHLSDVRITSFSTSSSASLAATLGSVFAFFRLGSGFPSPLLGLFSGSSSASESSWARDCLLVPLLGAALEPADRAALFGAVIFGGPWFPNGRAPGSEFTLLHQKNSCLYELWSLLKLVYSGHVSRVKCEWWSASIRVGVCITLLCQVSTVVSQVLSLGASADVDFFVQSWSHQISVGPEELGGHDVEMREKNNKIETSTCIYIVRWEWFASRCLEGGTHTAQPLKIYYIYIYNIYIYN